VTKRSAIFRPYSAIIHEAFVYRVFTVRTLVHRRRTGDVAFDSLEEISPARRLKISFPLGEVVHLV